MNYTLVYMIKVLGETEFELLTFPRHRTEVDALFNWAGCVLNNVTIQSSIFCWGTKFFIKKRTIICPEVVFSTSSFTQFIYVSRLGWPVFSKCMLQNIIALSNYHSLCFRPGACVLTMARSRVLILSTIYSL